MKSLLLRQIGELQRCDSSPPVPGRGEVLLRVTHCSLCRTDAKMWRQGHRDLVLPRVPGHEVCGFVPGWEGTFVVWPGESCGECRACREGRENLCRSMRILGFHRDGGLAELVAVPKSSLIPVPTTLPEHLASMAEPLACTLNALERAGVVPGEEVLVLGAGPVGLMMGLAVQASGARPFIVDPDGLKLERSGMFRLKTGMEASTHPPGNTFDVVINAAPALSTLSEGIPRVRSGGRFCLFSGLTGTDAVSLSLVNELHYREIQVCGAYGCTKTQMERALSVLDADPDAGEWLVEERISLDDVEGALSAILGGRVLKYVVELPEERA